MAEIMAKLAPLREDPYARAREAKKQGRKVVGVTPMHFPEEMVAATGALPVVLQESTEPVTLGFGYIYPFYCGFSRSNVDWGIKGKLNLFDAIVVSDVCLQLRHMGHIVRRNTTVPFAYIQWPLEANASRWMDFTLDKLQRCQRKLEEILGVKIEDKALREQIALYNRNRALLRRVYQLRQQKPGLLRAKELVALTMGSMVMPREESNQMLEALIPELEQARPAPDKRVKLFVSGHLCQAAKADILDIVEDLGGVVVGDDLYTGYRYCATDTPTDLPPQQAMAHRYLNLSVPCPTRLDTRQDWADYLIAASRLCGAKGIVTLVVKFCEPHMIYYPYLKDRLAQAGVPHLLIETEHEVVSLAGTRTRIQAFLEMLR